MIGSGWRTSVKDAAILGIQIGASGQLGRGGAIQQVDQPEPLEACNVKQTGCKLRYQFDDPDRAIGYRALNRSALRSLKGVWITPILYIVIIAVRDCASFLCINSRIRSTGLV